MFRDEKKRDAAFYRCGMSHPYMTKRKTKVDCLQTVFPTVAVRKSLEVSSRFQEPKSTGAN